MVGAVARACAVMRGRCARALEQSAGFTLTEALTTVIIVGLVTTILAGGIGLATEQYTQQMRNSEAQMLYSSLQKILDNELRVVEQFEYDEDGNVTDFESKHYMAQGPDLANMKKTTKLSSLTRLPGDMMVPTNPSTPGQLAMATGYDNADEFYNPLLPSAAYNYGLQASVKTFTYDKGKNCFKLQLVISRPDGQIIINEIFTVRPLNFSATGTITSSGEGSGSGGNNTGTSTGGKELTIEADVEGESKTIYRVPVMPFEAVKTEGAASGTVLVATTNNSTVYYVANKELKPGSTPSTDPSNGNSANLIPIVCGQDGKPVVYSADEVAKITQVGTLCIGTDKKLYILTNNNGKISAPPGDNGHWQIVSDAKIP